MILTKRTRAVLFLFVIGAVVFFSQWNLHYKKRYTYPDKSDLGIVDFISVLESREKDDGGDPEIAAWRLVAQQSH